ncbi:hypothetical protein AL346_13315 [Chelatococcus sp. CO-6]|nr:hypothetical protein AL346_13315 [Chelatococcus sp. CO-6]
MPALVAGIHAATLALGVDGRGSPAMTGGEVVLHGFLFSVCLNSMSMAVSVLAGSATSRVRPP